MNCEILLHPSLSNINFHPFASSSSRQEDLRRLRVAVGDDLTIYLDRNGWQITMKSACGEAEDKEEFKEEFLWPMIHKTTATPLWASDRWSDGPERKVKYLPYPTAAETIFGFDFDDESDPDLVS